MLKRATRWVIPLLFVMIFSSIYYGTKPDDLNQSLATYEKQETISIHSDSTLTPANNISARAPVTETQQLDEDIADYKYENLKRMMSIPTDTLDEYQLEMVVQQIISELPELVNKGKMHPLDAMFAHTQAVAKLAHQTEPLQVDAIKQHYIDLYPFPINSNQLHLH